MQTSIKALLILSVLVVVLGILFWPTLYRYDHLGAGDQSVPLRINRLTGHTQMFIGGDWYGPKNQAQRQVSPDTSRMLDSLEQYRISGHGAVNHVGFFKADIYNGTNCTVTQLFLTIAPKDRQGRAQYRRSFQDVAFIQPLTTKGFILQVGNAGTVASTDWTIDSARGTCPKRK
jgi:hypothetical protein